MLDWPLTFGAAVTTVEGSWLAAGLALAIAVACAVGFGRLRGTTLAAPAAWGIVSALAIAVVEVGLAWHSGPIDPLIASLWRYAAAVSTFCPLMAVLGAKRPQDRGWQWVVLTLWIVLLVPAGQAWAARWGDGLELSMVWRAILVGLMALVQLNYSPTRYIPAALTFTAGQIGLLAPYLEPARMPAEDAPAFRVGGLLFIFIAALFATWPPFTQKFYARKSATLEPHESVARMNQRWLAFRDGWGAFWALRVLNRVNESAKLGNWPARLEWNGFAPSGGPEQAEIDQRVVAQIEQAMDSLLRRFERLDATSTNGN